MNEARLPDEILLNIITQLLPKTPSRATVCESYPTLRALSLCSRSLHRLTEGVLCQDLAVPSAEHGARLLRTLREPAKLEQVRRAARTVWFGDSRLAVYAAGDYVGEILATLGAVKWEAVGIARLEVTQAMLWSLSGTRRIDFYGARFEAGMALRLPSLVTLSLANTALDDILFGPDSPVKFRTLLNPDGLPRLATLVIAQRRHGADPHRREDCHAALCQLAPQLKELHLRERGAWAVPNDSRLWSAMARLRSLGLVEPDVADDATGVLWSTALLGLAVPLDRLSLSPTAAFAVTARNLIRALERSCVSVQALRSIGLPARHALKIVPGLTSFYQKLALKELTAVAKERGMDVTQK